MARLIRPILAGALAALAAPALAQTAWDFPTPYPDANFHTRNILEFAEDVGEATGGSLTMTVHANGSLIEHADIKTSVRDGIVPIGEVLVSRLENDSPVFGIDSVPFLATSYEDARKLYDAQRPALEAALAEQGLKLLFSVPWPPQGLFVGQEVAAVADLNGLTFRAYNLSTERVAELAGMVPTQIEAPDIPTAFATGRVKAMMTSPSTGVDSKAWDFVSTYYDLQAWLPRNMVIVSQAAFDALSREEQAALTEAAAAAETRGWEMSQTETQEKTQALVDNGMSVLEPSETLSGDLGTIGETMTAEWEERAGEAGAAILDAYRAE